MTRALKPSNKAPPKTLPPPPHPPPPSEASLKSPPHHPPPPPPGTMSTKSPPPLPSTTPTPKASQQTLVDMNEFPSAARSPTKFSRKPPLPPSVQKQNHAEQRKSAAEEELKQVLQERNMKIDLGNKYKDILEQNKPAEPVNRYEPVWKSGRAFKPSIPQPYISLDMNGKDDSPPPPLPSLPPPPPPPSFDYDINDLPPPPPPPAPSENDQATHRRGKPIPKNNDTSFNNNVKTNINNNVKAKSNFLNQPLPPSPPKQQHQPQQQQQFAPLDVEEKVRPRQDATGVDWDPTQLLKHLYNINLNRPEYFSKKSPFPLPTQCAPKNNGKRIIVIDMGHCSMRAGVLCTYPTLPEVFFPSVTATKATSGGKQRVFGIEALTPEMRRSAVVAYPLGHKLGTKASTEDYKFGVYMDCFSDLFRHIFNQLQVNPGHYKVLLSIPQNFALTVKLKILEILFDEFGVQGVTAAHQNILALYAYDVTTGIVVNVGDRVDITPVLDGYCISDGVSRMNYGGEKMCDQMAHHLADAHHSFFSEVDQFLVRYVKEQTCYIADDLQDHADRLHQDPDAFAKTVDLTVFGVKPSPSESGEVTVDGARFLCPEGLISPAVWGLDNQGLPYLVSKAIMAAGIDSRRQMAKNIYLCGGGSQIPGLASRLEAEVEKLLPSALQVQVHAHPFRDHASFLGATVFAELQVFDRMCVSREEWENTAQNPQAKFSLCQNRWLVPV